METAIEQMRLSRSEHAHKHDPLVGALLVSKDGRELGKTYRGSLRVGSHAEYILIERLLKDKNLEGAALYVTLEPCTGGAWRVWPFNLAFLFCPTKPPV